MSEGVLHALLLDGKGSARRLDWAGVDAWSPNDGVLWLNLDYSQPECETWLHDKSTIDPIVLAALVDPDPRPRAIAHDEDLLLIVRGINLNAGAAPEDMISVRCYVEARRVITLRHRISTSLKSLTADLDRAAGPATAADLVTTFIERSVDHVVTRVDTLGDAVAAAEEGALAGAKIAELRSTIADHRRRAIALRRFLGPQREALGKLAQVNLPWLDPTHRARINELADRMTRTVEELDAARDRAAVTQEELGSRLAEVTNQRLYVLSMITAVFLPLGFVCSLFSLNVGGVPLRNESWAWWVLLGLFGVGVAVQLWLFKKRGWL